MEHYELDDQVTFYFVIKEEVPSINIVKAWTDDKQLAKFYMKFHNCKKFHLKAVTKKFKEMVKILNENTNDEIYIMNLYTKSNDKKDNGYKDVQLPMTEVEMSVVHDEASHMCSTFVDYSNINNYMHLFKNKYKKALNDIKLGDVIQYVVYNRTSTALENMEIDGVRLFFKIFCEDFD